MPISSPLRLCLWLSTAAILLALAPVTLAQPSAMQLARAVDAHYNLLHSLRAGFREQFDGLGMTRDEAGTLLLQKPGKMRWEYSSTPGKLFVLDGKYAWFYAPGDTQVQRIPASQLDDLRSPLRFLLGHTKLQNELTNLTVAPAQPNAWLLTGIPKGQEKRVARLQLTVTETGQILAIEIDELDGARTRFHLSNEQPNPPIPPSAFHFIPPPGVPVVDALPPV
jgi:outer membrane lipoprotein carrier protein